MFDAEIINIVSNVYIPFRLPSENGLKQANTLTCEPEHESTYMILR